jgi:hypothetical protein
LLDHDFFPGVELDHFDPINDLVDFLSSFISPLELFPCYALNIAAEKELTSYAQDGGERDEETNPADFDPCHPSENDNESQGHLDELKQFQGVKLTIMMGPCSSARQIVRTSELIMVATLPMLMYRSAPGGKAETLSTTAPLKS